ncbi:hypothetical protein HPULCUR_004826 [Helicostylum pulchrum]|uniref:Uncharacterized protein n=1 Tax=Helicostylum pulchrum TaxID=562976 RepID=A0ABP9XXA4_9FUNG
MNSSNHKSSHLYSMETRPTSCPQKKLNTYSRTELTKLRDKNALMLSNHSMIGTLPDKGAKLKETNQIIESLLVDGRTARAFDEITASNTTSTIDCPLTKKLEDLSVLTPRQCARKRSVDYANKLAHNHYTSSSLLTKPKRAHGNYPSIFYDNYSKPPNMMNDKAKVRMLTLDESVSLQTEQKSSIINVDVIQEVDIDDIELPVEESEEEDYFESMLID